MAIGYRGEIPSDGRNPLDAVARARPEAAPGPGPEHLRPARPSHRPAAAVAVVHRHRWPALRNDVDLQGTGRAPADPAAGGRQGHRLLHPQLLPQPRLVQRPLPRREPGPAAYRAVRRAGRLRGLHLLHVPPLRPGADRSRPAGRQAGGDVAGPGGASLLGVQARVCKGFRDRDHLRPRARAGGPAAGGRVRADAGRPDLRELLAPPPCLPAAGQLRRAAGAGVRPVPARADPRPGERGVLRRPRAGLRRPPALPGLSRRSARSASTSTTPAPAAGCPSRPAPRWPTTTHRATPGWPSCSAARRTGPCSSRAPYSAEPPGSPHGGPGGSLLRWGSRAAVSSSRRPLRGDDPGSDLRRPRPGGAAARARGTSRSSRAAPSSRRRCRRTRR